MVQSAPLAPHIPAWFQCRVGCQRDSGGIDQRGCPAFWADHLLSSAHKAGAFGFRTRASPSPSISFACRPTNDAAKAEDMVAKNRVLYDRIRSAGGLLYPVSAFPM